MKTIILALTTLLFVSIVFNSCKKKPHHPDENYGYYSLKEFRDYIYFKKGTWWLYKNNHTHQQDCVYVISVDTGFGRFKYDANGYFQTTTFTTFKTRQYSTHKKCTLDIANHGVSAGGEFGIVKNYFCSLPYPENGESLAFLYPFDIGTYNILYDSLTVKGKTYKDVVRFYNNRRIESDESLRPTSSNQSMWTYKPKYYWAKNFGLIKMSCKSLIDNPNDFIEHSWELIDYNIIQ